LVQINIKIATSFEFVYCKKKIHKLAIGANGNMFKSIYKVFELFTISYFSSLIPIYRSLIIDKTKFE